MFAQSCKKPAVSIKVRSKERNQVLQTDGIISTSRFFLSRCPIKPFKESYKRDLQSETVMDSFVRIIYVRLLVQTGTG